MKKLILASAFAVAAIPCTQASTLINKGSDQELSNSLGITILDEPNRVSISLNKDAPRIVRYFNEGARMPSCGLITKKALKNALTPILNVDAGEDFPNCASLNKAVAFNIQGEKVIAVQYSSQETRNEIEQQYFFAKQTTDGDLQPISLLNDATPPKAKTISQITAWAQLQIDKNRNVNHSTFLEKDSVATPNGYYGIRENKVEHICTFIASPAIGEEEPLVATRGCTRFLASTVLAGKSEYFVGLYEGLDNKPASIIFSISNSKVKAEVGIEEKLNNASASGKILTIKNALKKLIADQ